MRKTPALRPAARSLETRSRAITRVLGGYTPTLNEAVVERLDALEQQPGREAGAHVGGGRGAEALGARRIVAQAGERVGERGGVARCDQDAGLAVAHDLGQPAVRAGDHAAARRGGLERAV